MMETFKGLLQLWIDAMIAIYEKSKDD